MQLEIETRSKNEFLDITRQVEHIVSEHGLPEGVCYLFVPHTTAGLTLNENWDQDVRGDLLRAFAALVPDIAYRHGEGNSPAHLMSTLVGASQSLLIENGRLVLGSWQGVYLAEFDGPRRRRVLLKIIPDPA